MSAMIESGSSVLGLSEGDDRLVRSRFDGPRHHRALARIAVAAATEHAYQPAAEMPTRRGEGGGEGGGGMRIVDE